MEKAYKKAADYLITIIVPVFNVDKYLEACIESLLHQTHKNVEIILVDDCSPDKSAGICDNYAKADDRIKVIHKKENGGVFAARNTALEICNGDFIMFIDGDDYIAPDMAEVMLGKCMDNSAEICCCQYYSVNFDGTVSEERAADKEFQIQSTEEIIKYNLSDALSNKMFSAELFNNIEHNITKLTYKEDCFLLYLLSKNAKKQVVIPNCFYYYVKHGDSLMNRKVSYKFIDDALVVFDVLLNEQHGSSLYPYVVNHYVMSCFFSINSIIRNSCCEDRLMVLKQELGKYKKYVFSDKLNLYSFRHKIGTFMVLYAFQLYKLSIKLRTKLRGY